MNPNQIETLAFDGADDLPDIVDLVMEMGRTTGEAPSPAPQTAPGLPAHLETLAERARDYLEAASSANTRRAYAADWKHFCAWARRQTLEVLPPDPQTVGLYITACASGKVTGDKKPNSVATIERRLSSLTWNYTQRGQQLDRKDRHIATVMAGIRNSHAKPPVQKEAILPEDLIAMLETLDRGTRCVVCATAPCCFSASPGGYAAPKSSVSTLVGIRPKMVAAGSRFSKRVFW